MLGLHNTKIREGVTYHKILRAVSPPGVGKHFLYHDIAVLIIEAVTGRNYQPICLPPPNNDLYER